MASPSSNSGLDSATTRAFGNVFIPEVWSKKLLKIFDHIVVMKKLVNTDYEGDIKNAGDSVNVRLFGNISIGTYTRDSNITYQNLTASLEQMTIDQQKYFAFTVDDLDNAQSDINVVEGYSKRAAIAIRDTVDTRLLSHYADTDASNVVGLASAPITVTKENVYELFVSMGKLLDDQKVEKAGRNVVVTPYGEQQIREYMADRQTALGDKAVTSNGMAFQNFAGFTVYTSTNVPTATSSKPYLFFTRDYITFASQVSKVEKTRPSDMFADAVKGLYLYGSKVFTQHDGCGAVLYASA